MLDSDNACATGAGADIGAVNNDNMRWLLLVYRTPVEPSTARVRVWRRVRELGGLYIQQAACIFPDMPALRTSISELAQEITSLGGEAFTFSAFAVSPAAFTLSPETSRELIEKFKAQSDQEYQEIIEQCNGLLEELARETAKEKFTFAEIEENNGDLSYIERWCEKSRARDFFGAKLGETVDRKLEECRARMREFEAEVFKRVELGH